jgi:hypothetical protein
VAENRPSMPAQLKQKEYIERLKLASDEMSKLLGKQTLTFETNIDVLSF